jgi:hypothetical protein
LIDRRTARLSLSLAAAGSLMLTAGLGILAVSALSKVIPRSDHTVTWLAAVALITGGICCGVLMIAVLLGSGATARSAERARPGRPDAYPYGRLPPGAQRPGPPRPGMQRPGPPPGPRPPVAPPAGPPPGAAPPPGAGLPPTAGPPPRAGQVAGAWSDSGPGQPVHPRFGPDAEHVLDIWPADDGGPGPDGSPGLDLWPVPDPGARPGDGPPPGDRSAPDHGFSAGGPERDDWSGRDSGLRPGAGPEQDLWPVQDPGARPGDVPPAEGWSVPDPGYPPAAGLERDDWSAADAGFGPADDPVPDDWAESDPGWSSGVPQVPDDDWVVLDHPGSPGADPALDTWPPPSPGSTDPEPPAEAGEPEDVPASRVESTFNVWGAPDSTAESDAGPAPAAPEPPEQDRSAPDHDLNLAPRRDADLLPAAGLLPPVRRSAAEPAELPDPPGGQADQAAVSSRAARSSPPASGWNPDSEEDWLRVLRGLRASEDG